MTSIAEQYRAAHAREQQREAARRTADADVVRRNDVAEREARMRRYAEEDARHEKERAKQLEADRLQRVKAEEARLREQMRVRYLVTPGSTEEGFRAAWPEMLRQVQIDRTLGGSDFADEYRAYRRNTVGRPE